MAERHCRAQMRREIFRILRMKRRRAHSGKDREVVQHASSHEVFDFSTTKDILHELIHPRSDDNENIPSNVLRHMLCLAPPPARYNMDSLLQDMDSLLKDMDSLLEPILVQDFDMNSMLEPIDSLLEPINSLLEPIAFNNPSKVTSLVNFVCRLDSLLEPVVLNIWIA